MLPNPSHNTGVEGQHVGTYHQPVTEAQQTNPELTTQMYQSGSDPALAAHTHQSDNTNSQQRASVNDNPLVSHIRQLRNSDPALQETHGDDPTGSGERQFEAHHAGQQLGANDNDHVQQMVITIPHTFDPEMIDAEDDNTFVAQGVITEYRMAPNFRSRIFS